MVILKGGKSRLFRSGGAPIVYGGAVDAVVGRPPPPRGAVVAVADGDRRAFGWGFYNPDSSMFCVRMMSLAGQDDDEEEEGEGGEDNQRNNPFDVERLLRKRVSAAVALRRSLGLPGRGSDDDTDAFRLVNSEGDRLSGLVVDSLGPRSLVVASSAAWCEERREMIERVLLEEVSRYNSISSSSSPTSQPAPPPPKIIWTRSAAMMKEEGVEVEIDEEGEEEDRERQQQQEEEQAEEEKTVVVENGIKFFVSPGKGQKTGFYADQRESRLFVRRLVEAATSAKRTSAKGEPFRVLDLCCFHGGFSLSAAAGGATDVVGVDSSAPALEVARANAFELNGFSESAVRFERGDAGEFLKAALRDAQGKGEGEGEEGEEVDGEEEKPPTSHKNQKKKKKTFDLIVLDPPKLAPTRSSLPAALRRYQSLNAAAMRLAAMNESGGLLMTCSCSGAVAASGSFEPMLSAAAARAKVKISVLRVAGAAPCHAVDPSYPEGRYLTNVLLRVTKA